MEILELERKISGKKRGIKKRSKIRLKFEKSGKYFRPDPTPKMCPRSLWSNFQILTMEIFVKTFVYLFLPKKELIIFQKN